MKTTRTATKRRTLRTRFETREPEPHVRIIVATIGPGKARLLQHIEETGSIANAARAMGMSYLRAWKLVEALSETFCEPLVISDTGGERGGGSRLSPTGATALRLYLSLQKKIAIAGRREARALHKLLRSG